MAEVEERGSRVGLYVGMGCAGLLALLVLFVFVGYFFLTKTGLVGSNENFDVPEPTRVVEPSDSTLAELQSTITSSVLTSLKDGQVTLVLDEATLTTLLRDSLGSGDEVFQVERVQVAVIEDALEVYLPMTVNERETALTLSVSPYLSETGEVQIDIVGISLGNLELPRAKSVTTRIETALTESLDSQLEEAQGALTLTQITVADGALTIQADVDLAAALPFNFQK